LPKTAAAGDAPALQTSGPRSATAAKTGAIDELIPWLLDEETQLRGIPFSEVIVDAVWAVKPSGVRERRTAPWLQQHPTSKPRAWIPSRA
jgi:hypothetical protein